MGDRRVTHSSHNHNSRYGSPPSFSQIRSFLFHFPFYNLFRFSSTFPGHKPYSTICLLQEEDDRNNLSVGRLQSKRDLPTVDRKFVTKESNMAYKRSITSSHESDNSPANSFSSVSYPSGCSRKYEWIWDCSRRAHRLPRTPTISIESSESRRESDFDSDEAYNCIDDADCEVPEGGADILQRMAATAETQRLLIEQLEQALEAKTASERSARTLTAELAERVASLACFNIQVSLALVRARALVKKLSLALGVGVVVVSVYVLFK